MVFSKHRQANEVDLASFLRARGEKLIPSGRDLRLERDYSVTIRGSRWYDHATGKGGGAVSFVQTFCGLSYADATLLLLGGTEGHRWPAARERPRNRRSRSSCRPPTGICAGCSPI